MTSELVGCQHLPLWPHVYSKCNACLCIATMCAAHCSSPLCHLVPACLHQSCYAIWQPIARDLACTDRSAFPRHWGMFLHSHPQPTTLQPLAAVIMQSLPLTRPLQQLWWVRQAWQELAPPAHTRPRHVSIALETMLSRQEPKRYSTATSKPHLSSATRRCHTATVRKSSTA